MQPLSTLPLIWLSSLPSLSVYPHTPSVPFCLGLWTESKPCLGAKIGRTALHRAVELLDTEIRGDISARFEHWTRESKDAQEMISALVRSRGRQRSQRCQREYSRAASPGLTVQSLVKGTTKCDDESYARKSVTTAFEPL